MVSSVFQLQCSCNNYPWGRRGTESLAAVLCSKTPNTGFKVEDKEYAEMWMGDYPVLPAKSLKTGEDLHKIVDENKEQLLGKKCMEKFGGVVPFLPKILSIAKALPLQIHPDKDLAQRLHAQNPEQFTDDNHKPEIAIALGPFEVFAGWKPTHDIQSLFSALPPLQQFLPNTQQTHFNNETIRNLVSTILKSSDSTIRQTQLALQQIPKAKYGQHSYILDLLPRLQDQYSPTDPGNLVALLTMNFLSLSAGSAIYVPASCPHAYLSGNIVECMARSNNVLNTGFCPRPDRDSVDLFCTDLTFAAHSPEDVLLPAKKSDKGKLGNTSVYAPPMGEFDMLRVVLESKREGEEGKEGNGNKEVLQALGGPAVCFCVKGEGRLRGGGEELECKEGYVFFVGAGTEVEFEGEGLEIYVAYAE